MKALLDPTNILAMISENDAATAQPTKVVALVPSKEALDGPIRLHGSIREVSRAESTQLRTDVGNGRRLVIRYGKDLRYCPAWDKWLIWDKVRWRIDDDGEIMRRAKKTIRAIYVDAYSQGELESLDDVKHALRSESQSRLNAMIALAQSERGIPVSPHDLDAGPLLLNCLNGTLDLTTGTLKKHSRYDLITKLAPVDFIPEANCPLFDKFIRRITSAVTQNRPMVVT
jgi:putative DNA primase/helicase